MVDTSHISAPGYMKIVQRQTLLTIIQAHVAPGIPNILLILTNTHNVESYWNRKKTKLKRMKGCNAIQLPSYLDKFMRKERHGTTRLEVFDNVIRDSYPVPSTLSLYAINYIYNM